MARKPPPPETRFKPGQSGNPGGGLKLPAHIREFRKTTYEDFINALQRLGGLTPKDFHKEVSDPTSTMFQGIFAKMVEQAHEGDRHARVELLERLWGKVKEVHEIQTEDKLEDKIKHLSPEKQEQLIELLREASKHEQSG